MISALAILLYSAFGSVFNCIAVVGMAIACVVGGVFVGMCINEFCERETKS